MNRRKRKILIGTMAAAMLAASLTACGSTSVANAAGTEAAAEAVQKVTSETSVAEALGVAETETAAAEAETAALEAETAALEAVSIETAKTTAVNVTSGGAIDTTDMFTERDLTQTADLTGAKSFTVADGEDITITEEGVYVITGSASEAQIIVEADDTAKVQIVLDGVTVTNESKPVIYVKSADKVFVTTTDSENSLSVTGTFVADGDTNTDAVIFSKEDLVLNGTGTLSISSTDNGITSKDDLKVTGGSIGISCAGSAIEAHDSIAVADGSITVTGCSDGLHAEDDEDDTVGYVYICGGTITIQAADDGIHATTVAQIDGGTIDLKAAEGIEATQIQINDGTVNIEASDDGINAAQKSTALSILAEFNGGYTTVVMEAGDTDAVDSNGDLTINGGTLDITAQSPFDYDGTGQKNGGTLIVNGTETEELANQFMGGGPQGGMGGMSGGMDGMQGGMGGGPHGGMGGGPGR